MYCTILPALDQTRVSKLRPAGHIQPAKTFHPAYEDILSIMKTQCIYKKFIDFVVQHIPKQSYCVRCPVLELLCSGSLTKKFEPQALH